MECATGRFPYQSSAPAAAHLDFWELLECITEHAPPALPPNSGVAGAPPFSAPFRAFVEACLQKDPLMRPSAADLAQHVWLEAAPGEEAGGPGGAAGERLLAELAQASWASAAARRGAAALPPLQEEAQ
jgi:serine/threonine protein kinase